MLLKEENEALIRRYLLGQLTGQPELNQEVEERLLSDDDFVAQLEVIEAELIEDYVRGQLSAREKADFEQHFALTPKRRQQLATVVALQKYTRQNPAPVVSAPSATPRSGFGWLSGWFSAKWQLAALAMLVLATGFGVWRAFFYESPVDQGLFALARAYRERRPLETRISGFAYAPFVVTRGANDNQANSLDLDEAEVLLRKAAREKPDAAGLRGLGLLYLAKKDFAKAITQFEQALKLEPQNARLHSELGTALLEKSQLSKQQNDSQQSALEIRRALEELNQALNLDSSLLEALFNRALCRQMMALDSQAVAGWQEYLQKDSSSPWAEEARRNLLQIEKK